MHHQFISHYMASATKQTHMGISELQCKGYRWLLMLYGAVWGYSNKNETLPCGDFVALGNPVTEATALLVARGLTMRFRLWMGGAGWFLVKEAVVSVDSENFEPGGRTRKNKGKDEHRHKLSPSSNISVGTSAKGLALLCLSGKSFSSKNCSHHQAGILPRCGHMLTPFAGASSIPVCELT